jgi:hypothetical protein
MIRDFEHIATVVGEVGSLEELRQTTILIDAADYIETRILRGHEPLLPALGGLPFSLGTMVQGDLAQFAQYNIEPCFIFNGIDLRRPADPFQQRRMGTVVNEKAWSLYERHKPEESVMQFKDSREPVYLRLGILNGALTHYSLCPTGGSFPPRTVLYLRYVFL